jgi:tetratricopeptide (TPR) repeat protein
MRAMRAIACLLTLAGLMGCRQSTPAATEPTTHARPAAAAQPARAVAPAMDVAEARALALADPRGDGPLDSDLRRRQAAADHNPTRLDLWVAIGHAWMQKARADADPGAIRHAEAAAAVVLATAPEHTQARQLHAMVLVDDHRFTEARDLARAVLATAPDNVLAWGTLSDALLELGDFEGAVDAAQRMVDLKPGLPSYARAAWLRWLGGDVEGARTGYKLALSAGAGAKDREPASWVLVEAAETFRLAGDLDGAEAGFDLALAHFPEYPPALAGKARVLLARGDAAAAVPLFERSLALRASVDTAGLLAAARDLSGDSTGAARARARAVAIGERGDGLGLARFYADRGEAVAEAVRLAEQEAASRGGVSTQDVLAWALYRAGRLPEARRASDRARALKTPDPRLLYHAGAIRVAQGEVAAGRALVAEALAMAPEFDPIAAPEARKLLESLPAAERPDDGI